LSVEGELDVGFVGPRGGNGREVLEKLLFLLLAVEQEQSVLKQAVQALPATLG